MGKIKFLLLIASGLCIYLVYQLINSPFQKLLFIQESPQVVFVLGGDLRREKAGIKVAKKLNLPLIISSGSNPEYAEWLMKKEGIKQNQFKLDYRAKDTLTNFTSIIDELSLKGINHMYLITSEDHLPRALIVGNIIAGSRGIKLTSISVSCKPHCKKEGLKKKMFDLLRASTWVVLNKDLKEIAENNLYKSFNNQ